MKAKNRLITKICSQFPKRKLIYGCKVNRKINQRIVKFIPFENV